MDPSVYTCHVLALEYALVRKDITEGIAILTSIKNKFPEWIWSAFHDVYHRVISMADVYTAYYIIDQQTRWFKDKSDDDL